MKLLCVLSTWNLQEKHRASKELQNRKIWPIPSARQPSMPNADICKE